jgi:hypothetical protein
VGTEGGLGETEGEGFKGGNTEGAGFKGGNTEGAGTKGGSTEGAGFKGGSTEGAGLSTEAVRDAIARKDENSERGLRPLDGNI